MSTSLHQVFGQVDTNSPKKRSSPQKELLAHLDLLVAAESKTNPMEDGPDKRSFAGGLSLRMAEVKGPEPIKAQAHESEDQFSFKLTEISRGVVNDTLSSPAKKQQISSNSVAKYEDQM